jgi:hypothetical protein
VRDRLAALGERLDKLSRLVEHLERAVGAS